MSSADRGVVVFAIGKPLVFERRGQWQLGTHNRFDADARFPVWHGHAQSQPWQSF